MTSKEKLSFFFRLNLVMFVVYLCVLPFSLSAAFWILGFQLSVLCLQSFYAIKYMVERE